MFKSPLRVMLQMHLALEAVAMSQCLERCISCSQEKTPCQSFSKGSFHKLLYFSLNEHRVINHINNRYVYYYISISAAFNTTWNMQIVLRTNQFSSASYLIHNCKAIINYRGGIWLRNKIKQNHTAIPWMYSCYKARVRQHLLKFLNYPELLHYMPFFFLLHCLHISWLKNQNQSFFVRGILIQRLYLI